MKWKIATLILLVLVLGMGVYISQLKQPIPEQSAVPQGVVEKNELAVLPEESPRYTNTAYNYSFVIPQGGELHFDDAFYTSVPEEEAFVGVELASGESASFNAMRDVDLYAHIKEFKTKSAEEYVTAWWGENKNSTNPNIKPEVSPVFKKEIQGIDWFGFKAEKSIDYPKNTGGGLLNASLTVLVAKHGDTFYSWQVPTASEEELFRLLETFQFTNK